MNHELDKYQKTYSLKAAVQELNLSISDFSDLITQQNISAWIYCPPDKSVRLFYEGAKFSFNPAPYVARESCCQANFLAIDNITFKTIALEGKTHISRFDAIILDTDDEISAASIHEEIREKLQLLTRSRKSSWKIFKNQPKYLYKKYIGANSHKKWFGLVRKSEVVNSSTLPAPQWLTKSEYLSSLAAHAVSSEAQTDNVEKPYPGSLDNFFWTLISASQGYTINTVEKLWIANSDVFFFKSDIRHLKDKAKTFPSATTARKSTNRLDMLNDCIEIFANEIETIVDPEKYWSSYKDSSIIAKHIKATMNLQSSNAIEYYTKVVINDPKLFSNARIEITHNKKYPDHYPLPLVILNIVRDMNYSELPPAEGGISKRKRAALEQLGIKSRAANILTALISIQGRLD